MSNLLTVQDSNNELGIGSSFISLGSNNNLKFKTENNTLLEFNTSNNTLDVGTVKQSTWQGNVIDTSYGGSGLTTIGSAGEVLTVKNDTSGLEWVDTTNSNNSENSTNIATQAQSSVTIGNINQDLSINTSSNFLINLQSNSDITNKVIGYNIDNVQFIDEVSTSLGNENDLWVLMNYFYPGYKLLLMDLVVKTSSNSQNLITFHPFTYNYSLTLLNSFTSIIIIPSVFNNSTIKTSNNTSSNNNDINEYNLVANNSINNIVLSNNSQSVNKTYNFNFKIKDDITNIYTLEIIQKQINVIITGYKSTNDRVNNTNPFNNNNTIYYNNVIYLKIEISEDVSNLESNDILVNNGSISEFTSQPSNTYYCKFTPTTDGNYVISINSGVVNDNLGNINSSAQFIFIYDTVRPFMTITGYYNSDYTNEIAENTITNTSGLEVYIKIVCSESTDDFETSDIVVTNGTIELITNTSTIYKYKFTCGNGSSTTTCSIGVPENSFSDSATNTNPNNPSNTFSFINDTVAPVITDVTPISTNTNDNTPSYVFNTDEAGTITLISSNSLTLSSSINANVGDNTITFNTINNDGTYNDEKIKVTDVAGNVSNILSIPSFTVDTVAPVLDSVTTSIGTTNNPIFTFTSDKSGTINISSGLTIVSINSNNNNNNNIIIGNNTLVISASNGIYNNKEITITDVAGNVSNILTIPLFTVDITAPIISSIRINNVINKYKIKTFNNNNNQNRYIINNPTNSHIDEILSGVELNNNGTMPYNTTYDQYNTFYNWYVKFLDNNELIIYSYENPFYILNEQLLYKLNDNTYSGGVNSTHVTTLSSSPIIEYEHIQDNEYYLKIKNENTYLKVVERNTSWGYQDMDSIFWASITTPNNDYYKFTFELDTNVLGITNDTTPSYIFNTDEAGTITSSLSLSSNNATVGNNTITFSTLSEGQYSNKQITVTDLAGNVSNTLTIPYFKVDTSPSNFTGVSATSGSYTHGDSISITVTFNKNVNTNNVSLILSNGATVNYTSGSGSQNIIFNYTIAQSDVYSKDLSVNSFTGSIKDIANNSFNGSVSGSLGGVIIYSPGLLDSAYNTNNLIGAYALNKLFTDYNGPTIQVVKNNIYYNIYFNNNKEIIGIFKESDGSQTTDSIIGNNVTKWYDQSNSNHDLVPGQYVGSTYNNYYSINNIGPELIVDNSNRFSYTTSYSVKFRKFDGEHRSGNWRINTSDTLWLPNGLSNFSGNRSHTIICSHYSTLNPDAHYTTKPDTDNIFSIGKQGSNENSESPPGTYNPNECIAYHPNFYSRSYYYNYGNQAVVNPALESDNSNYTVNERLFFTLGVAYNSGSSIKIFKNGIQQITLANEYIISNPLNIIPQINSNVNFELGNFSQRNYHGDKSIASRFDGHISNFMLYNEVLSDSIINIISTNI